MIRPTLTKIVAADGQTLAVTTRIDNEGLLRVDVFAGKERIVATGTITAIPGKVGT